MHFIPERLEVLETPPQTEEEWAAALELYVSLKFLNAVVLSLQS